MQAKACRQAGLQGVTPYVLRHTGATLLAAAGVPMRQVAGMLGHSTQKVTERYAKHRAEFLLEAAETLENLFGEKARSPVLSKRSPKLPAKAHSPAITHGPRQRATPCHSSSKRLKSLENVEPTDVV